MIALSLRVFARLGVIRRYGLLEPLAQMPGATIGPMMVRVIGRWLTPKSSTTTPYGQRLAQALEDLGPTFIKLGQILATRGDLVGIEVALALQGLQDNVPPFDQAEAARLVALNLEAPLGDYFSDFGPVVAAASIAQVHFATTSDGQKVAVKILRPGVEAIIARDLADLGYLAALIEWAMPSARRLRPKAVVETLTAAVAIELDLRMEAAACAELGDSLAQDPDFRVPKVDWRRTSKRILTLSRVTGVRLSDLAAVRAKHDGPLLARRLVHSFLRQAMLGGFFHADLHPGNLFVADDGALVAVDFGIMGRLSEDTSRFLALILKGFVDRDYRAIADIHVAAGYVSATHDIDAFAQALRAVGEPIFDRPVAEISMGRLLTQLFEVTHRFHMPTQPQLLMLQKTMVVVEGVARSLDPNLNMFEVARPVIEDWMARNLGPAARLSQALRLGARVMTYLDRLTARESPVQPAPPPVAPAAPSRLGLSLPLALSLAALALALLSLALRH